MSCDAGGGTVDLITYEIKRIEPYLELAELLPGTGKSFLLSNCHFRADVCLLRRHGWISGTE